MLLPVLCSCRLLLASLTLKTAKKKLSFTFHPNMLYFWSFSRTKTGAGLFKMCLCSYFAHCLFCQCTNIFHKPSFVSSAFILTRVTSQHRGLLHLLPPRLRQEEAFFSLRWWTGFILSLVQKKKQSLFFSVHPYHNLLAKTFFYSFGRPGVFLSV